EMAKPSWVNTHFWLATIGIVIYMVSMWVAGITQGLMWRAFDNNGFLVYGNFMETVTHLIPLYAIRAFGGLLFLIGAIMMTINVFKTISGVGPLEDTQASAPPLAGPAPEGGSLQRRLEARPIQFAVLTLVAVAVGGLVELVPLFSVASNVPTISTVKPYTPLELEGRDIYIREGCYVCHSQMVRPFRAETERYGDYSKAGEFIYDHPFQFGSKRTGPDLHRVGGKYPDMWHYRHMEDPRSTSPGSIMPSYAWLVSNKLNASSTKGKMKALRTLGVPYSKDELENASNDLKAQADAIAARLAEGGVNNTADKEIVALIAYLQRLGQDIKKPVALMETAK
ncbi:MAG: cytochrome-c oxidase, cbb3-type subunit II, partial [Deltaproteobacteria bacterium]|nr:cytochrome-c oxidase, cbb3-type subunit II [Deltaproteobacteria bacterium]